MMKEFTVKGISPIETQKAIIWSMFDVLKSEGISSDDYYVALFLLTAYKDQLFSTELSDSELNYKDKFLRVFVHPDHELINRYAPIIKCFEPILNRISEAGVKQVFKILSVLNFQIIAENYPSIFDNVLYKISVTNGRNAGEFILPEELSRFLGGLAELEPGAKIYNPFAGPASFGAIFEEKYTYFGQEINKKVWAIGALRLLAHQKMESTKYTCEDSVINWPAPSEKFDLVISAPPFGMHLNQHYLTIDSSFNSIEHFLIGNGLNSLKSNGKLIVLLPQSFLDSGGKELSLRKYLIEDDLIETLVSLPDGLLYNTGIPLCVLVLNKEKKISGKVRFVNAKEFTSSDGFFHKKTINDFALNSYINEIETDDIYLRVVDNEKIKADKYNLSVKRYFQRDIDGVKLGDIVEIIRGQKANLPEAGKLIHISDLKNDEIDFQLDIEKIDIEELPSNVLCIEESCIIVALRWKTLKPTYFEYKGTPIYLMPGTLAFKIDESRIDLQFLINELHANYILDQIDLYRTGALIPMIKRDDLLSVIVSIPDLHEQNLTNNTSLEKQRALVKQRLIELAEEKKKELNLFSKIHGLENEIFEQNTYLRHTLAGPSSNLKDSIASIRRIIQDKLLPNQPHILELKISDKHLFTLGEYLAHIERDADRIVRSVGSQLKVDTDIAQKKLTPIEIIDFFENYTFEYNERPNLNFEVEFDFDEQVFVGEDGKRLQTYILANEDLLRDLFNNMIDNAIKHAFLPEVKNRIEISLMKGQKNDDQDDVVILVSNTGKPLPVDFSLSDFIRKGFTYGPNAGDGFGGWYINEIVKKLNGELDFIDETGDYGLVGTDLTTSFEIYFPIIEVDENV